jgi:hypothetical protein
MVDDLDKLPSIKAGAIPRRSTSSLDSAIAMIGLFVGMVLVASLASGPAWWVARRRGTWLVWDYVSLVSPFGLWLVLAAAGFGSQSLGNLVEPVVLVAVIPIAHSVRVFFVERRSKFRAANSIAVLVIANLVAIGLRAFVPLIPE